MSEWESLLRGYLAADFIGNGCKFIIDQAIFIHVRDGKGEEIWAIIDSEYFKRQVGID